MMEARRREQCAVGLPRPAGKLLSLHEASRYVREHKSQKKGWNQSMLRFEVFVYHLHAYRPQLRNMSSHEYSGFR